MRSSTRFDFAYRITSSSFSFVSLRLRTSLYGTFSDHIITWYRLITWVHPQHLGAAAAATAAAGDGGKYIWEYTQGACLVTQLSAADTIIRQPRPITDPSHILSARCLYSHNFVSSLSKPTTEFFVLIRSHRQTRRTHMHRNIRNISPSSRLPDRITRKDSERKISIHQR